MEPALPTADDATDSEHTGVEIVFVKCEVGIDDVTQEEMYRSVDSEPKIDLCHGNYTNELEGAVESRHNKVDHVFSARVGDRQNNLKQTMKIVRTYQKVERGTGGTNKTLPSSQYYQLDKAYNKYGKGIDKLTIDSHVSKRDMDVRCDICKKTFTRKSYLKVHMFIHTGERPHTCNVCEATFIHRTDLKNHMFIHTGERPYSCTTCGASFAQSGTLIIHMRIHTGEKPFRCSLCEKSFRCRSHLSIHMRFHTGEKPYTCNVCNTSFSSKYILSSHMRTHTGEKPYICGVCGSVFSQSGSLSIHMRSHTGEKPFKCGVCERSFSRKCILSQHMRVHNG